MIGRSVSGATLRGRRRVRSAAPGALLLASALGCASTDDGRGAVEAYRDALYFREAEALRARSSPRVRAAYDAAAIERWMRENPRLVEAAVARFDLESAEILLDGRFELRFRGPDGRKVRLSKEEDGWVVVEGGLLVPELDTPEGAARTFFFAISGHLELLRETLTDEAAEARSTEYRLGRWLYAERDRLFAARDAVGPIDDGRARVEGERARIPYEDPETGEPRAVRLVRQGDRWRVAEVE